MAANNDKSPSVHSADSASNPSGTSTALAASITNGQNNRLRQKRARSQLSCTPCRQGKLKCNRQHDPACDQCIKRSRESACLYLPPPVKHKPAQNVKGRIRQLESLVVDLINQNRNAQSPGRANSSVANGEKRGLDDGRSGSRESHTGVGPFSQPTPPSDSDTSPQFADTEGCGSHDSVSPQDDVDAATTPFGQMKISKNEISYVGDSHWGAILSSISDLKRELDKDEDEDQDEDSDHESPTVEDSAINVENLPSGTLQPLATTGMGFMLGTGSPVTRQQLIDSVPEKKISDRLLSLWFNSPDPFKPAIHAPTFQDEYRRFWKNPKDTPVMWLGLLYAILSLASSFGLRDADLDSPQARKNMQEVKRLHFLSASAAVLADFTKPKQYTVECLIMYTSGLRSNNAFVNVWLMIGLVVRLALRMGYHRDPSHYPAITVFQGEMRRRCWAMISMIDVLISFQLGLPSIIKTIQADAQPPRNLLDRDFNVSTQILPQSRGVDELTPSSYTRAKLRITQIFANAAELSHATAPPSHEVTKDLDRELEEAKAAIPPLLQMPDISEVVTDPAEQLMCRFNLDLLYLKTKTVLHRRYMMIPLAQLSPEERRRGVGDSKIICITCALRVLQHHHTIYTASQSGGQLESVKWYMASISTHDFLLAAMVICLELSHQLNNDAFGPDSAIQCPKRVDMMEALEKSQYIWSSSSGRRRRGIQFTARDGHERGEHMFDETEKASRAMTVMLEKIKKKFGSHASQTPQPSAPTPTTAMMQELQARRAHTEAADGSANPIEEAAAASNGAFSNYQWDTMPGTPLDLSMGGTTNGIASTNPVDFSSNFGNSQSSSNNTSPNQPDFSMIGDMLDGPVNLDWETWDSEIKGDSQHQHPYAEWADPSGNMQDFGSMGFDDAVAGGRVIPGNATLPGGTGPLNANFAGMDFNVEMMNDMSFDMGNLDYSKTAMWPPGG